MAAKKPDIWMPLYVADYQADTAYLTTEQHGAYLLMLMAYWRNGPIPDNDGIIASITRQTPDAWSIARPVLEGFFQVSGGFWVQKRVEEEYDKAKRNRQSAHEKAAAAAKARWDREKMLQALPEALPEGMPRSCPSPSPTTSTSKADTTPLTPLAGGDASGGGEQPQKAKRKPRAKSETMLADWLTACRDEGLRPIPEDDPIRQWAEDAGIPPEYMGLAWRVFCRDWKAKKPQKDWRATFRDAVKRNWLKLWYIDANGDCRLTTVGQQEQRAVGDA